MKRIFLKILFLLVLFSFCSVSFPQSIKSKVENVIKQSFADEISFKVKKVKIPTGIKKEIENQVKQKFFKNEVYVYDIYHNKNKTAVAILDNVYGKSMPITFLTIFDTTGSIISTSIIKYREPYGGAVSSEKWNAQFKGLNNESKFAVGNNINSITGATISVKSVTKGIHKLTLLYNKMKNEL